LREVALAQAQKPKLPNARRWLQRPFPRCAKRKPAQAPPCTGSTIASQDLDREETRAKDRIAELDLRLVQFAADGEREQRLAADAQAALAGLPPKRRPFAPRRAKSAGRRSGIDAKVAQADGELGAAEKIFSDLTTALADLSAQRNRFENAAREHQERIAKLTARSARSSANWRHWHSATARPSPAVAGGRPR